MTGIKFKEDMNAFIAVDTYRGEGRLNIFRYGLVKDNIVADADGQSVTYTGSKFADMLADAGVIDD